MTVTFGAICDLLQGVENISINQKRWQGNEKEESIRKVISNWFRTHRLALDDPSTNGGAILSILFPHRRKDRVYGMQAPSLATKLSKILKFNHVQNLLFDGWKTNANGDLGACLERAMRPWDGTFSTKRDISIDRLDRLLKNLAASSRFSDKSIRDQRSPQFQSDKGLREISITLNSWEAKWLVRMILRDHCTIELNEKFVFQQYHFLLPDLLLFQNNFDAAFGMLRGDLSCFPSVPDPSQEASMSMDASRRLKAVVGVKVGRPKFLKAWSFKSCFQLTGKRAWAAEIKYDGEYCEIHVDLEKRESEQIKIFSKNGKDATADRAALLPNIRDALQIGHPNCLFKSKCIVLGEMVVYSDKTQQILPFSKIRKHVARSGSFRGVQQDSLPHRWEHLMIIFFDILVLDSDNTLRHGLQERRAVLKNLIPCPIPGRSMRSEWTLLDFKTAAGDGITDLKQAFARTLANRQEGLVLKPLHAPYFPLLLSAQGSKQVAGYFIKLKKDYLADMGGQRDLGDFAVIGASYDAQVASKSDIKPLHWTYFYLGCCMNRDAVVQKRNASGEKVKPKFKVVARLSLDQCIPKADLKYLNIHGYLRQTAVGTDGSVKEFDIEFSRADMPRFNVAFKKPFVAEILGGGYEKVPNETFEMLRHPRINKIHHDRTWEDANSIEDLAVQAAEQWGVPDADELNGHARDVALLVKKYTKEMSDSQSTVTTILESTQQTTQKISPKTPQPCTPREDKNTTPLSITSVQETPQQNTFTTISSSSPCFEDDIDTSTQAKGTRASRELRVLVREDTSERLNRIINATTTTNTSSHTSNNHDSRNNFPLPTPSSSAPAAPIPSSSASALHILSKKRSFTSLISPPKPKRRRVLTPLSVISDHGNRALPSGSGAGAGDSNIE